jgi:hypothetical protein
VNSRMIVDTLNGNEIGSNCVGLIPIRRIDKYFQLDWNVYIYLMCIERLICVEIFVNIRYSFLRRLI